MAEVVVLTLANICLDVQIGICMFLHPSDILTLRMTCKALQPSTRQRIVWVAALHRVCLDNALFLPSFPISEMSDLELEKAAIGPRRLIELCGAFEKHLLNDPGAILRPRTTRNINDFLPIEVDYYETTEFFMVPGARYLVSYSLDRISVLDLGSASNADCRLIASVRLPVEGGSDCCRALRFQATPDGMGLLIYSPNAISCSVYEIYPQSETPHLTQIAHLDFGFIGDRPAYVLPSTVIWYDFCDDGMIFRVWDYRLNHSISFFVDVVVAHLEFHVKVMATKTAIIVLCEHIVLIWAIPPLSPGPPDFVNDNPTHMLSPLFTIPFPDDIALHTERMKWTTISSWYFGTSHPLYFDMLRQDSEFHRVQMMLNLKPDLSAASLHVINISELTPHDFNHVSFEDYGICEDTLVSCWSSRDHYQCGVYTQLLVTSARFGNVVLHSGPADKIPLTDIGLIYYLTSCPASGKFVLVDGNNTVSVLDLF